MNDMPVLCLHDLIEAQVRRTPEAIAVTFEGVQLTYEELNRRANQLAHTLHQRGVGSEALVGVYMERSVELVIALLAILKAGAAYLPLDPSYPEARVAWLIADACPALVLTQQRLAPALASLAGDVLALDAPATQEHLACCNTDDAGFPCVPAQLAYLIYTSGSTGQPKGAMNTHEAICNRLLWMQEVYGLASEDRVLQKTPFSFDVSVWEFFWPLICGAQVVIARPEGHKDSAYLSSLLAEASITTLHFVPSMLRVFLEEPDLGRCSAVQRVICSGEALSVALQERFFSCWPGPALHNLYGPTEAAIDVTFWPCQRESDLHVVPIGYPIANTSIYLLDTQDQPVSGTEPGELCIGGIGLARGYLKRPDLTAERFLPDPFSSQPGARIYRTGDLARFLPNGAIDYLGRLDHQVKLRGFRIELGEIEATLLTHSGVRESVVIAHEEQHEQQLVAYVVPAEPQPTSDNLANYLRARLPEYMVPSAFVFLPALPLTTNGKLDRRALPPPHWEQDRRTAALVIPRTPMERLLLQVWSDLLPAREMGVRDNFFALGGHSLLAMQMLSRVRTVVQEEIPLHTFFTAPTIEALAACIEQKEIARREGNVALAAPPIVPLKRPLQEGKSLYSPPSFAQQQLWLVDQLEPGNPSYIIMTALRLHGTLDLQALIYSIDALLQRHEVLRATVRVIDGIPMQVIPPTLTITLPIIDLVLLPDGADRENEVARLSTQENEHGFDLAQGPLIRTRLLRLSLLEHVLLVTTHHSVSDGWSIGVLIHDLQAYYSAFVMARNTGVPVDDPLPSLSIQYADYASWQRDCLRDPGAQEETGQQREASHVVFSQHLAYWKQQLAGAPALLDLPRTHPRPLTQSYRGASETLLLEPTLVQGLTALGQHAMRDGSESGGYTLFMCLLAVFQVLLARYTGSEDIVVGTPFAHRNRPEMEDMIGYFINALALRTDLSGAPTFLALLKRVHATCLGAYQHQDLPFELLLEELKPGRSPSYTPVFQVFFNLLNMVNFPTRPLSWPDLRVEASWTRPAGAKFDLTLYVQEMEDGIHLEAAYNADLFEPPYVRELLAQFKGLIAQVIAQPDVNIAHLSLVTAAARACLPDPVEPLSAAWEGSVFALFSAHARRSPACPAVIDDQGTWSYQQLDILSNQLAHALLAHDLGRQSTVAIYADRSASLILAILGVLKTGASYLILDPAYQAPRLADYCQQAAIGGCIQLAEAGSLPTILEETIAALSLRCRITLHRDDTLLLEDLAPFPSHDPDISVDPDDIACIAFTSGSTGRPKGVLQRHGPLTHFIPWQQQTFQLVSQDRYSLLSALAHDPLQRDIFTPLCLGASISVPSQAQFSTPGYLAQWMHQTRISITNLTPATLRLLTYRPSTTPGQSHNLTLSSLRVAFIVGDILTFHDVAQLHQLAPDVSCVNLYGSTETQRALSYYIVPRIDRHDHEMGEYQTHVPLGRGFKDVQLLVLNKARQLAGINELGEISMRSPHLARGYLGDDALTHERFIQNPFTQMDGDRLYQTGDIGSYLADGNIYYRGRNDQQIQVRGFRVEPGEIEAVLAQHADVREAVVVACEDASGEKRLVAYVVPASPVSQPSALKHELWQVLRGHLPAYMLPSAFVFLTAFPLLPNNKVHRKTLPPPSFEEEAAEQAGPRNPQEEILADLWAQVLGVRSVGIHEDFFEAGGHSLLATQLLARIQEIFHVTLPFRTLFEAPSVAAFASLLEHFATNQPVAKQPALVPLARKARRIGSSLSRQEDITYHIDNEGYHL